jgi:hypothetical protein
MDSQQAEQRYRDYCAFEGYDPHNPPHERTCSCPECDGEPEPVISPVAQSILTVIKESTKRPGSYIAGWHICDQLGVDRTHLDCSIPGTKYDIALKELIDAGLIEELPELGCRYRLCKNEE